MTKLSSTTTGSSIQIAPALDMSSRTPGHDVTRRPRTWPMPAATRRDRSLRLACHPLERAHELQCAPIAAQLIRADRAAGKQQRAERSRMHLVQPDIHRNPRTIFETTQRLDKGAAGGDDKYFGAGALQRFDGTIQLLLIDTRTHQHGDTRMILAELPSL